LVIKFYVTAKELSGAPFNELWIKFWDPAQGEWRNPSHQRAVLETNSGHIGYVEVTINKSTTPSLNDLSGTEFALGNPIRHPDLVQRHIIAAPQPFCPGWNLHYRLELTNTTNIELSNFTIEAALPGGDIWTAVDGGSTVAGVYNPSTKTMSWSLGDLPSKVRITAYVIPQSYSSVTQGTTLHTTFTFTSTKLSEAGIESGGLVANANACGSTPEPTIVPTTTATPTMTPIVTPTATPIVTPTATPGPPTPFGACYLPLVIWK
jgi:hypothetical protein